MRNTQTPSGRGKAGILALLIALCILMVVSGCQNPTQLAEAGTGTVSLTIGGRTAVRTIMPDISLDDFVRFDLVFAPTPGSENTNPPVEISWEDGVSSGRIDLEEGSWSLTVTAFLPGNVAMASGGMTGFWISAGEVVSANITLSPITGAGGMGRFSWDIDFDDVADIVSASMTITHIAVDGYSETIGTFHFVGGTGTQTANPGEMELTAGQYWVVFRAENAAGDTAVLSTVLHVYNAQESKFTETFTDEHFQVSLLDTVWQAWDDGEWNFEAIGITDRHFYALNVSGVTEANFDDFAARLNLPLLAGLVPANINTLTQAQKLARLGELTDAALIVLGSGNAAFLAAEYETRGEAQLAIIGLAENASPVFTWTSDTEVTVVVTVDGSPVEIKFVFGNPISISRPVGTTLAAQLVWLVANAEDTDNYLVEISGQQDILSAHAELPTGRNNTIIIRGTGGTPSNINLNDNGYLFTVPAGVTLVLDGNVTLNGRSGNTVTSLVSVANGGRLIMNDGTTITGNVSSGGLAAVTIDAGGAFTMNGGEISGNTTSNTGGVEAIMSSGTGASRILGGVFTMNGGRIHGNTGSNGGVVVGPGATFNMNGGVISGNTDLGGVGGVSISGTFGTGANQIPAGTFRMSNGTIYGIDAEEGLANTSGSLWAAATSRLLLFNDAGVQTGTLSAINHNTIQVINGVLVSE